MACHDVRDPGFANERQVELFVDAGFTPLDATSISTLNVAKYLGRDRTVSSLEVGKQADFVPIKWQPAKQVFGETRLIGILPQNCARVSVGCDRIQAIKSVTS